MKRPEVAYPHFKQLDVERQIKQSDGSWSDWEAIDQSRNLQVLDNLPEEDEEWTPDTVRISALVAPLPFLKAGFWERVHIGRMVPAEKLKVAEAPAGGRGDRETEGRRSYPVRAAPARPSEVDRCRAGSRGWLRRHGRIDRLREEARRR